MAIGHTPQVISAICSSFIQCGGSIVLGRGNILQICHKVVSCILTFTTSNDKKGKKTRKLLATFAVEIKATIAKSENGCSVVNSDNSFLADFSNHSSGIPKVNPPVDLGITTVEYSDEVSESFEPPLKCHRC